MTGLSPLAALAFLVFSLPIGIWVARAPSGVEVYANRTFVEIMGTATKKDVSVGGYSVPYGILTRDGMGCGWRHS